MKEATRNVAAALILALIFSPAWGGPRKGARLKDSLTTITVDPGVTLFEKGCTGIRLPADQSEDQNNVACGGQTRGPTDIESDKSTDQREVGRAN